MPTFKSKFSNYDVPQSTQSKNKTTLKGIDREQQQR